MTPQTHHFTTNCIRQQQIAGLLKKSGRGLPGTLLSGPVNCEPSGGARPVDATLTPCPSHLGNLAFEIGNEQLERERSQGIDLALRHHGEKVHASASFFYYHIPDLVLLAPTGKIRDGLIEAEYLQNGSRFVGSELRVDVSLHDSFWLNLGVDAVDAQLQETSESLPRIPPLRGHVGFELRHRGLSFKPQVVMAGQRDDIFSTETRTAGYTVINLAASYTIARQHFVHQLGVNVFNVGDRLYRNHASFIKDLAPEIGRGVRLTYTVKFF